MRGLSDRAKTYCIYRNFVPCNKGTHKGAEKLFSAPFFKCVRHGRTFDGERPVLKELRNLSLFAGCIGAI